LSIRILATSPLVGPCLQELGSRHPQLLIAPFRSPEWDAALPEAEALVVLLSHKLTPEDLERAPRLKAVGTYSVGMDNLPLEALHARGIQVVNTPGVLTEATADIALALLLAVTRRVAEGEALARSGNWKGWAPDQLLGIGLAGKTCGILGGGAIGKAVARRVAALGMKPAFWARERAGEVDYGFGRAPRLPLAELLPASAVLSLNCPLTPETRGLLSAGNLDLLPRNAVIINTARGGIMDELAAIERLHNGHLAGVGLDVYEGEPVINPAWFDAPRTVLLPHLGSATVETRADMARLLCDGIAATLGGKLG
jgi:glyoxylate reductase